MLISAKVNTIETISHWFKLSASKFRPSTLDWTEDSGWNAETAAKTLPHIRTRSPDKANLGETS
jgi:hypothetical protein